MTRGIKILIFILLYLLFSSRSCDDDASEQNWQQHQAELVKDSIRAELQTDVLSEQALRAAEANAIQEINDLADYVEIYTDISLDSLFRVKAGEMIRKMFISEDVRLSFGPVRKEKIKLVTLKEFLDVGFGENIIKTEIHFDTLRVVESIQKSGEDTYSGKLTANQTLILHTTNQIINSISLPVTINFISSRQIKIIGQDTVKVWKVSLGDIDL